MNLLNVHHVLRVRSIRNVRSDRYGRRRLDATRDVLSRSLSALTTTALVTLAASGVAIDARAQDAPAAAAQAGSASQAGGGAALTLAELEQRALAQYPAIAQAAAQVDAAKGRAVQAGMLPNPTVGYVGDEISGGPVNRGGEHGFFIQQTIPLGGKLSRGRDVFTREAAAAQAATDTERQRVLTAVRRTYRAALIADRRVAVRDQLARLATEAVQISGQLFNTGVADKPDTLAAEIEAQRAQLALVEAKNARRRVWRELGLLVGDPTLAPGSPASPATATATATATAAPTSVSASAAGPVAMRTLAGSADDPLPDLAADATLARILKESPEIEAARRDTLRADAALGRARREAAPDLVLRAGPRYNRELLERDLKPVGWEGSFEVGITVPLFNRNQGGIAEAGADLARSQAAARQTALSAAARVAGAFEQYDTARRSVDIYQREILPRASEAYAMYRRSYEQMAAAYPQVLLAQRTLFQSQDQYLDALDRAWEAAITLEGFTLDLSR
jgi:cobalt-zinc-cadmium efflux system outer membrane protein